MEKNEPLVSIVMPIYNSETYLDEAILSIIHQTYENWELLVINEFGSSEEGKRIINRYASIDSRIRLIQNEVRLGIAESLNEGLRQAKGEYIARMDGDDISLPKRIEKQVEFMEENKNILLCGVQVEVFGSEKWDWKLETDPDQIRADALFYSPCVHPTILFRRDIIDKYNVFYNKDYKASEDYDFFTRVLEHGDIANVDGVLFKYRLYGTNATYVNNNIGFKIYSDVMERQFHILGVDFSRKEVDLLSVHYSLKGAEGVEVLEKLVELDLLLKKIFYNLYKKDKKISPYLFKTLHRRFKEACEWLDGTCKNYDKKKAENIYKNSVFYHEEFYVQTRFARKKPRVSVLLPVYNSEKYIAETLWSLFDQTFSDFELLVLNEYGSSKVGLEVVNMFADNRIRIIQNKKKLGLADSLNLGMKEARGEYLARIDGDDLARSDRFAIQVDFLDKNKEYGICGSLQHHFGINTDYIHNVPEAHEDIAAGLIYDCLMCHSTIMMRKEAFLSNKLFYDKTKQAEDYELWTRASRKFLFYNIQEVLGEYRVGDDNITKAKMDALSKESGELAGKNIKETLGIEVPVTHVRFLSGWINEFQTLDREEYKKEVGVEQKLLEQMWEANERNHYYDSDSLLKVINRRWRNITNTWEYNSDLGDVLPVEKLFEQYDPFNNEEVHEVIECKNDEVVKTSFKEKVKNVLRFLYKPFKHGIKYRIRRQIWDLDGHLHESTYDIKNTVWDIEGRIKDCIKDNVGKKESTLNGEAIYERLDNMETKINILMEFLELKLSSQDNKTNENIEKSRCDISEQLDARVWKAEKTLGEQLDARVWKAEKSIGEQLDARVWKAEKTLGEQLDARVWKAEKSIGEQLDARVWKAEKTLGEQLDARVWKSEKSIGEQFDARVWKAEKTLGEQFDARVWKAEKTLGEQFDARVWKAEENINKTCDNRIWKSELYLKKEILSRIWVLNRMLSNIESSQLKNDEYGATSIYGSNFYEENQYGSFMSAVEVLQYIMPIYKPSSLVDFGCGTGTWLAAAKQINREIQVVGVDGDYVDRSMLMIKKDDFLPKDLTKELDLHRKFDMAMSLEVAEHLEEKYADTFVDTLCRHSDTILFSAAHVGQGGDGHVNEQPIDYWVEKFKKNGYIWRDIRDIFKDNYDIEQWYKDNIAMFIKKQG